MGFNPPDGSPACRDLGTHGDHSGTSPPVPCWGPTSSGMSGTLLWAPELGVRKSWRKFSAKLYAPTCLPCISFLELSKSQNDMTSNKQHPEMVPRQREGRPERRSQSDTAINVTTRVSLATPMPARLLYRVLCPFISKLDIKQSKKHL